MKGCPGSGKTTLASRLAADLGLTHIELDSLHWRPGWEEAPPEQFRALLDAAMEGAPRGWITCGNYRSQSQNRHVARADTVVFLDLPRSIVMRRVALRTIRRAVTREKLYGNNVTEPLTNFYRWAPEQNVIRWAWVHYDGYHEQYEAAMRAGDWDHATVHHLRTPAQIEAFAHRSSS